MQGISGGQCQLDGDGAAVAEAAVKIMMEEFQMSSCRNCCGKRKIAAGIQNMEND